MTRNKKILLNLLLACVGLVGALGYLIQDSSLESVTESHGPSLPAKALSSSKSTPVTIPTTVRSLDELQDWARQDPHAAMEWAAQQSASEKRDETLATACFQIAREHPENAVALAEKFQLTQHAVLENLAQQWAQKDTSAAYDWVLTKPGSNEKNKLVQRIALVWAASEPESAAEFVVEEIPPGSEQTEAAITILHQWALRDFQGANTWAQQFPEGSLRERALAEIHGVASMTTSY